MRLRAEKQRADLSREVEDLSLRLEEASGTNTTQAEINRKRESEVNKLRREIETSNTNHDQEVFNLRKKNNDILQELNEQIDNVTKIKSK